MRQSFFAVAAATLLLPQVAGAQVDVPSNTVSDLSKLLKPGEILVVIDDKGESTAGKLTGVSPSTLTLQVPGKAAHRWLVSDVPVPAETRQFALDGVRRINRNDSLKEGALVGFAAGLGLAIFTSRLCDSEDFCGALAILSFSAIVGGPVVGALIDHSITTPLYHAPGGRLTAKLGLSPRLQRKGGLVSLSLAF